MLSLDASQLSLRWNETADFDIVGQEWKYEGLENSDDKSYVGFSAVGKYAVVGVENTLITISSD